MVRRRCSPDVTIKSSRSSKRKRTKELYNKCNSKCASAFYPRKEAWIVKYIPASELVFLHFPINAHSLQR